MTGKGHAGGLGPDHFQAAQAHARGFQSIAVAGPVGHGARRKEACHHFFEGRQQGLAGDAQDAAVLPGERLYAVLGDGAGTQGRHRVALAERFIPGAEQGIAHFVGNGRVHDELFRPGRGFADAGRIVRVHGAEREMDVFEQLAASQQQRNARLDGDGETARHGHVQHVAQFAQVGGFAADAVGHAGVHLAERQGQRGHVAAGMLFQLALNAGAQGLHGRIEILMALIGNVVEAGGHALALDYGPPGLLAHLAGFQAALAALGRVQGGHDARQIGIGLQQFLEGGVTAAKGGHGLLAADARLEAQKFFQALYGVHQERPLSAGAFPPGRTIT